MHSVWEGIWQKGYRNICGKEGISGIQRIQRYRGCSVVGDWRCKGTEMGKQSKQTKGKNQNNQSTEFR